MLDAVGLPSNPFKKDVRKAMNGPGAEDLWIRHPLAAKLLGYAAADVAHLIPAREKLLERIAAAAQKLAELKSERYADEYRGADSHRLTAASRRKPWGRDLVVEMDRTAWTATYEEVAPFSEVAEGPEDEDEDEQAAASAAGPSDRKPASAPVAVSVDADLDVVLDMLPEAVRESLVAAFEAASQPLTSIMELVFDFGSQAQAYTVSPSDDPIRFGTVLTREDVAATVASMRFSSDNRAGIDRHIHRVSRIPNKEGLTVGVTIRIARVVEGVADALGDVLNEGKSVLILGRPGQGKTTLLRDICRFVSTVLRKRSMIVDTSCEIGGDGDVPHPAVGQCRRFQVRDRRNQYNIMLEAVKNHTPDVVVIDELGDRQECTSAKAISQRGVQLVATAHGSLGSVLSNPDLSGLVGGLQAVIHGDASASRLGLGKKTQVERAGRPTCDIVIELHGRTEWVVYRDVADAVDRMLAGERYGRERRWMDAATGRLMARFEMVDGRAERDEIRL
ncbi:hypothetical protein DFJ74DRAFT_695931 [Hyaloraphidium curvatum]|nr:hypothetical protein DFJ74DRAFT_695931 [Hyaloraphidium curvatum]